MAFSRVPQVIFSWPDNNGNPASGWLVNTYEAGTTTPVDTYSDDIGTANDNPVVLDDRGEAPIFLSSSVVYKFVITNPTGGNSQTFDNITGVDGVVSGGGSGGPEGALGSIQYNFDGINQAGFGQYTSRVLNLNTTTPADVVADFSDETQAVLKVEFDEEATGIEMKAISGSSSIKLGDTELKSNDRSAIAHGLDVEGDIGSYAISATGGTTTSIFAEKGMKARGKVEVGNYPSTVDESKLEVYNVASGGTPMTSRLASLTNTGTNEALRVSNSSDSTMSALFVSDLGSGTSALAVESTGTKDYAITAGGGTVASIYAENGIVSDNSVKINGKTDFGRLSSLPVDKDVGDSCYMTPWGCSTEWNGVTWRGFTEYADYSDLASQSTAQNVPQNTWTKLTIDALGASTNEDGLRISSELWDSTDNWVHLNTNFQVGDTFEIRWDAFVETPTANDTIQVRCAFYDSGGTFIFSLPLIDQTLRYGGTPMELPRYTSFYIGSAVIGGRMEIQGSTDVPQGADFTNKGLFIKRDAR